MQHCHNKFFTSKPWLPTESGSWFGFNEKDYPARLNKRSTLFQDDKGYEVSMIYLKNYNFTPIPQSSDHDFKIVHGIWLIILDHLTQYSRNYSIISKIN